MFDIVLIDKDFLLLQALEGVLMKEPFIKAVNSYDSGAAFLKKAGSFPNESNTIVITEIITKDVTGLKLIEEIKKQKLAFKLVILSGFAEIKTIKYAIQLGADGYLTKTISASELMEAIKEVGVGKRYISTTLRDQLMKAALIEDTISHTLSKREKEVLQHICSGKTIKEAANEMGLSNNTVQSYHKSVLKKLKINRTADLIVFAIQSGLYVPGSAADVN